ncbi:hypothetical protein BCR35DRAFT_304056 [Leucosporidium creatinivorum]|uniref:DDE-1 domain-containing protein n=1 Tax=Leucosporidium creatinivorum TaxID=106004 RepID=A0A1Y2FBB9_9BASI|nr:hypothetical protein BCR35DRAFT_304056 [Leucosporidium creatinivorum]
MPRHKPTGQINVEERQRAFKFAEDEARLLRLHIRRDPRQPRKGRPTIKQVADKHKVTANGITGRLRRGVAQVEDAFEARQGWFANEEEHRAELGINRPEQVWDVVPHALVFDAQDSNRYVFTLIETVSAAGSALTPELILRSGDWSSLPTAWAAEDWYRGAKIGLAKTEEMTSVLDVWLKDFDARTRIFINEGEWRQLILGADERDLVSGAFLDFASSHRIDLCFLRPNDTHLDHPLDKNILPSIQVAFAAEVAVATRKGKEVHRLNFFPYLKSARDKVYNSQEVITEAFRSSGLWPLNGDEYREEEAGALARHQVNMDARPNKCAFDSLFDVGYLARRGSLYPEEALTLEWSSGDESDDDMDIMEELYVELHRPRMFPLPPLRSSSHANTSTTIPRPTKSPLKASDRPLNAHPPPSTTRGHGLWKDENGNVLAVGEDGAPIDDGSWKWCSVQSAGGLYESPFGDRR